MPADGSRARPVRPEDQIEMCRDDATGESGFRGTARLLKTARIGKRIVHLDSVESTNGVAWKEAEQGARDGTVVVAEEQTRGRGRLERVWYSPRGLGIWMSVILRPQVSPEVAPGLTLCASLAVARSLRRSGMQEVSLKWPNDVTVGDKKLCGILTEMKTTRGRVDFVVCGIGLNVNQSLEDFPSELREKATSVFLSTGARADRRALLFLLLEQLDDIYELFLQKGLAAFMGEWRSACPLFGRIVRVRTRDQVVEGVFYDIEADGALVLRLDSGVHRRFLAGDVEPVS